MKKNRHYNFCIDGAGEPILLLHGFSGDCSTWNLIVSQLRDNYQLIALDLLGHGASDKPHEPTYYQMDLVAADIIELLDQLSISRVHLLGYSMGGRLALYLALHYAERFSCLILESASPGLANPQERAQRREQDNALAERIIAGGVEPFVEYWESLPLWASQARLPSALLEVQRCQRRRNHPLGLANSLRGMGSGAQLSLWGDLPNLAIPTLLLAGELDEKFQRINRKMAAAIPRSQLVIIPSAGHNTHLEDPSAFCQAIRAFLVTV